MAEAAAGEEATTGLEEATGAQAAAAGEAAAMAAGSASVIWETPSAKKCSTDNVQFSTWELLPIRIAYFNRESKRKKLTAKLVVKECDMN
jgi:hypothetical protein